LPYQALDHVTGYLMAAAVLRALRLRAETGAIMRARLSLAGTGQLLLSQGARAFEGAALDECADDLSAPWAVAVISDEEFLVSERDGRLLHFKADMRQAVSGVPKVWARGQGGLLDVVLARDFLQSRDIFLTFAKPNGRGAGTALGVGKLSSDGSRIENFTVLFEQPNSTRGERHFGSRVVEAPNGDLFVTVGDRGTADLAQDMDSTAGKVIRVARDGRWEIHSLGHRNPQGATLDRLGRLWTVEHGARGGDEVNRPEKGKNYGWPVISYGTNYDGSKMGIGTSAVGLVHPSHVWDPSIAPSGFTIYSGKLFEKWKDQMFIGSLKFDMISRLRVSGDKATEVERMFQDKYPRIRDIREAPDGTIWFLSIGDDALYQIRPIN